MDRLQLAEFVKLAAIGPRRSSWANEILGLKRAGAAANGRVTWRGVERRLVMVRSVNRVLLDLTYG